jgi:hypothetical protein
VVSETGRFGGGSSYFKGARGEFTLNVPEAAERAACGNWVIADFLCTRIDLNVL